MNQPENDIILAENLSNPHANGVLVFMMGMLFILSLYHLLLYFKNRDKSFLLYSLYMVLVIYANIPFQRSSFIYELFSPVLYPIGMSQYIATEAYYLIYLYFAYYILEIKSVLPKWHTWMLRTVFLLSIYCIAFFVIFIINRDFQFYLKGYLLFTVTATIAGLISYFPFFKSKSPIKYYIIIGSLILLSTSWTSFILYLLKQSQDPYIAGFEYTILYIGFTIEVLAFALGLGHKQYLILKEKNESQDKLISEMQENQRLKDKMQQQLESDLATLYKQLEEDKLKTMRAEHQLELADLKLTALRNQMNPHFIFNTLNSIKLYIINNEQKNAVNYLNKFSKLIRMILANTREKEISLKNELETMELYLYIENIRFNGGIDYTITTEDGINLSQYTIPSLALQPFIENAIWHGLSNKEGEKKIDIQVKLEELYLVIEIRDNGIGIERSKAIKKKKLHKRESVGISLSQERLAHFSMDKKHQAKIIMKDLNALDKNVTGTLVSVYLPRE